MNGWIGVDLDGTLAHYDKWTGEIGEPIPLMVERVKAWLGEGKAVKILTARVSLVGRSADGEAFKSEQEAKIKAWCAQHIGQELEVVSGKDFLMIELWDDRCVHVELNTGRILG